MDLTIVNDRVDQALMANRCAEIIVVTMATAVFVLGLSLGSLLIGVSIRISPPAL